MDETPEANNVVRLLLFAVGLFSMIWAGLHLYYQRMFYDWMIGNGYGIGLDPLFIVIDALPYDWAIAATILIALGISLMKKSYQAEDILQEYRDNLALTT